MPSFDVKQRERDQMPERNERDESQQVSAEHQRDHEHESWMNQHKHEPHPASHHADHDEEGHDDQGHDEEEGHDEATGGNEHPGKAVRDMMGGPTPQGDVPDAPGTQIAAADRDNEKDERPRVRHVANAVPGKPDGEVDTRS